ncbi:hypothetical protein BDN70DRAFT_583793 [Pholiota conissans]|uniref:Uncharacterized protein n=1 Tax=Pholiota conissans TaxID=109636 RepID=A0A9P6CT76_9AGAR|nr:hypothetical protein BDN70DRAFT_583793 [Pholiota conissans]
MPSDGAMYFKRTPVIRPATGDHSASTGRWASPQHTRSTMTPSHRITPMKDAVYTSFTHIQTSPSNRAIRNPTRLEEAIAGASSDTCIRISAGVIGRTVHKAVGARQRTDAPDEFNGRRRDDVTRSKGAVKSRPA